MWALFAVYQAICKIIGIGAAAAGIPPDKISFPHALAAAPSSRADGAATAWGEYEPTIRRWERVLGHPAPPPAEPGPGGRTRLSAGFAEWMMGIPHLVTGVPGIPRTAQLRIIGNGVVPRQGAAALHLLIGAAVHPGMPQTARRVGHATRGHRVNRPCERARPRRTPAQPALRATMPATMARRAVWPPQRPGPPAAPAAPCRRQAVPGTRTAARPCPEQRRRGQAPDGARPRRSGGARPATALTTERHPRSSRREVSSHATP